MSVNDIDIFSAGGDNAHEGCYLPPLDKAQEATHIEGLEQFDQHEELFQKLTKRTFIDTEGHDVISTIITYDSKHAISIIKENDESI